MAKKKCMRSQCTELGNEVYMVPNRDEMIHFYEKDGKNLNIYPVITIIEAYYRHYQNTNVSINDLLEIIFNERDVAIMNEQEIHKLLLHNVFLPKISKKRALPMI